MGNQPPVSDQNVRENEQKEFYPQGYVLVEPILALQRTPWFQGTQFARGWASKFEMSRKSFTLKDTFLWRPYWHFKELHGSEEHSLREAGLVNLKFGLFKSDGTK